MFLFIRAALLWVLHKSWAQACSDLSMSVEPLSIPPSQNKIPEQEYDLHNV